MDCCACRNVCHCASNAVYHCANDTVQQVARLILNLHHAVTAYGIRYCGSLASAHVRGAVLPSIQSSEALLPSLGVWVLVEVYTDALDGVWQCMNLQQFLSAVAVCRGLPAATVPGNGFWPESCRNTLVGDFCISKVKGF